MQEDYTYFQDSEFREALAAYEQMVQGGEQADLDAETLTDIAEFYAMEQRNEEAERCIQYALSFYPDSVDPQIFLARQQMFQGNQAEAWRICRQIEDQSDREVMFLRGELLIREKKVAEASRFLHDEYLRLNDEDAPDWLYDTIGLFKDYDMFDICIQMVDALRNDYPEYMPAVAMKAEILNAIGDYQLAVDLIMEHIEDMPYDTQAWMQLAEAYSCLEKDADAMEAVDYVLAINRDHADALMLKAGLLFDGDEPCKAHCHYLRFLEYYPNDTKAIYMDAQCLIQLHRYPEAITLLRRLTKVDDFIYRGYSCSYLAYCYYAMEDDKHYLHYLRMACKEEHNCLESLFGALFPGVRPRDYYAEALRRQSS